MMRIPEDKEQKAFGLLGLARRARAITIGMDATLSALKKGIVKAILLANDIGKSSFKKLGRNVEEFETEACQEQGRVSLIVFSNSEELGVFLNKETVSIIGIVDSGFAKGIYKLAQQDEDNNADNNE